MKDAYLRGLTLAGVSLALVAALWFSPLPSMIDSAGLSALYTFRGTRTPPADIVIVALDANSARTLGVPMSPHRWSRNLHARLVDHLVASGADAIGFDLLFEHPGDSAGDAQLRNAIARAGNVVLAERVVREVLRDEAGAIVGSVDRRIRPLPMLAEAAWATAPFVLPKTDTGVYAFWTFPAGGGGEASMPVRLYERWLQSRGRQTFATGTPRDLAGLNLYGPFGSFAMISYADAMHNLAAGPDRARLGGKVVLIGLAESNQSLQFDAYRTPYSTLGGVDLSGVELAATAVANLIDQSTLRRPDSVHATGLVLGWTLLMALPWVFARARVALLATFTLLVLYVLLAVNLFDRIHLWLPVMFPLLIVPLVVTAAGLTFKFHQARGRHRQLDRMLATDRHGGRLAHFADDLVSSHPGRVVRAVCLCSDIVSYTTMTEQATPADARDTLNRYLKCFLPHIESRGGDVTDIVGDSIMSLWVIGRDPAGACQRALEAARALDACMNRDRPDGALPSRFGLHLGDVYFGEVGVGERTEIRPVGDVVNTASRIQDACKPLGLTLLASEEVTAAANVDPVCSVGRFLLKGKHSALTLMNLDAAACTPGMRDCFEAALRAFQCGDRAGAMSGFEAVLERMPDNGPARFYAGLCAAPRLPEDGVVTLVTTHSQANTQ